MRDIIPLSSAFSIDDFLTYWHAVFSSCLADWILTPIVANNQLHWCIIQIKKELPEISSSFHTALKSS